MPSVPFSDLIREGRLTPLISLFLVAMCILGMYLGAFSPELARISNEFSLIAGLLGGASHVSSIAHNIVTAWQNRQRTASDTQLVLADKPTLTQAEAGNSTNGHTP